MKIGLIGYKGCGKSALFEWLTGTAVDPAMAHQMQSANVPIPEPCVAPLCAIYKPKKVTFASIELVDTPGLSRDGNGNPARLGRLREADTLVVVAAAFDGADPVREIKAFRDDLILADLEIVSNRLEKVREQNKRPVPKSQHDLFESEIAALEVIQQALESNIPLRDLQLTEDQRRATRSFRLLNERPWMVLINTSDDEADPVHFAETVRAKLLSGSLVEESIPVVAASVRLELDLARMSVEEKTRFLAEMELTASDRDGLLRLIMDTSNQMLFLTAGEKEVRTWLVRKGGSAIEAAGEIHTDMAKGFIRAEVMRCDDLLRLGSERAVKAENLVRREPKDYVVQEGDIFLFHFSN